MTSKSNEVTEKQEHRESGRKGTKLSTTEFMLMKEGRKSKGGSDSESVSVTIVPKEVEALLGTLHTE